MRAIPPKKDLSHGARFAKAIRRIFKECGAPMYWGETEAKFLYHFVCRENYFDSRLWFERSGIWPVDTPDDQYPTTLRFPIRDDAVPQFVTGHVDGDWERNNILKALYFARLYAEAWKVMWEVVSRIRQLTSGEFRKGHRTAISAILESLEADYEFCAERLKHRRPGIMPGALAGGVAARIRRFWKSKAEAVASDYAKRLNLKITSKIIEKARKAARDLEPFDFPPSQQEKWGNGLLAITPYLARLKGHVRDQDRHS
jgi:hypothetical protein